MYAITGATGNIGSKVTDILLSKGEKVRVIGRDAARLQHFVDKGAKAAVGDLADQGFLTRAFTGATAVFAMIPPNYSATDFRAYQDEIGKSIATAIKEAQVSHVVNLSSQGAELAEGTGPIVGLHEQEKRLNSLPDVNILHLRATYFMENLLNYIPIINRLGFAGSAIRGKQRFAMIATRDIANRVAGHLVKRDFHGKVIKDLLGQRDLTLEEAFAIIGRKIGKPDLRYVEFTYLDTEKGMIESGLSPDISRLFIEMSRALNNGLFAVKRPRTIENTTPTSIEEFAYTFAAAFETASHKKAA
jgi:uncharacterized protein YbjT (DUF2867 family)